MFPGFPARISDIRSRFSALSTTVSLNPFTILKEQCHEDFAVLDQFCAKIVTFEALIINKMLL